MHTGERQHTCAGIARGARRRLTRALTGARTARTTAGPHGHLARTSARMGLLAHANVKRFHADERPRSTHSTTTMHTHAQTIKLVAVARTPLWPRRRGPRRHCVGTRSLPRGRRVCADVIGWAWAPARLQRHNAALLRVRAYTRTRCTMAARGRPCLVARTVHRPQAPARGRAAPARRACARQGAVCGAGCDWRAAYRSRTAHYAAWRARP